MGALVLKASAGTGKTYRLSLEYVKLLLSGTSYDNILVTTFTRKATAEIKDRITSHLYRLSKGNKILMHDLTKIGFEGKVDSRRADYLYKELMFKKDRVKIFTIDSFINSSFNKFVVPFFNLYGYKLIDESQNEDHLEEVLEKIIQKDKNFYSLTRFFSTFMEKDVTHYMRWIKEFVENRWRFLSVNEYKKSPKQSQDIQASFDNVLESLLKIVKAKQLGNSVVPYVKDEFREIVATKNRKQLLEKNYSLFMGLRGETGFWNGVKIRRSVKLAPMFEELNRNYEAFKKELSLFIFNNHLIPLEKDIFKLAEIIFKEYDSLKLSNKMLTYNDILIQTHKFMYGANKEKNFNLLGEIVDRNIDYVLIDEFQDTSILQWSILKPVIDQAKNFIAVGDEKQAIYGWRGGEMGLFQNLSKIMDCKEEEIDTCYRSEKEVVVFNNKFFRSLGLLHDNVRYLPRKNAGYVEVVVEERKDLKESLVETLMKRDVDYSNTAILARTNNELEEIAVHLKSKNIPYIKESSLSIVEHAAVKPLYIVLKFIVKNDFFDLIKFLRSDLINISSADMKPILRKREEIFNFLDGETDTVLYTDHINQVLAKVKELKSLDFHQLVKKVIEDFGVLKVFKNTGSAKNVNKFYEISKEFIDLVSFITYIEENSNSEDLRQLGMQNSNAVKLMTIHKSKGLEFETVFLAWNFSSRLGSSRAKLSFNIDFKDDYQQINGYCFTSKDMSKTLKYSGKNYQQIEKDKVINEELNNLYVGATRSQKNLFFFASFDRNLKMLDTLGYNNARTDSDKFMVRVKRALLTVTDKMKSVEELYLKGYSCGKLQTTIVKEEQHISKDLKELSNKIKHEIENVEKINEEGIIKHKTDAVAKIKDGVVIHFYLSHVQFCFNRDLAAARRQTVNKFQSAMPIQRLKDMVANLEEFVSKNEMFTYRKEVRILNEFPIIYNNQELRIDRLEIDNGNKVATIYDYKTGKITDPKQLDIYEQAIKEKLASSFKIEKKFIEIEI